MADDPSACTDPRLFEAVHFRRPALGCLASRLSQLTILPGNPLQVGLTYIGQEGTLRVPFTVHSANYFSEGAGAAWSFYDARGQASDLLPDVWTSHSRATISDSDSALRFYAQHIRKPPLPSPVTVYSVSVSHTTSAPAYLQHWATINDLRRSAALKVAAAQRPSPWSRLQVPPSPSPSPSPPPSQYNHEPQTLPLTERNPSTMSLRCMPRMNTVVGPFPTDYRRAQERAVSNAENYPHSVTEMAANTRRMAQQNNVHVALLVVSNPHSDPKILCRRHEDGTLVPPSVDVDVPAFKHNQFDDQQHVGELVDATLSQPVQAYADLQYGQSTRLQRTTPLGSTHVIVLAASTQPKHLMDGTSWVWMPLGHKLNVSAATETCYWQAARQWVSDRRARKGKVSKVSAVSPQLQGKVRTHAKLRGTHHKTRKRLHHRHGVDRVSRVCAASPELASRLGGVTAHRAAQVSNFPCYKSHAHDKQPDTTDMILNSYLGTGCVAQEGHHWIDIQDRLSAKLKYQGKCNKDEPSVAVFDRDSLSNIANRQASPGSAPPTTHTKRTAADHLEGLIAAVTMEMDLMNKQVGKADFNQGLMERIVQASRQRAAGRGAAIVTAKDVAEAAQQLDPNRAVAKPSPADVLPEHYDQLVRELNELRVSMEAHVLAGHRRPKVLIAGERHAVVARMFKAAGADVATSDFEMSDCELIPHYRGDMNHILDLGFDLVIGHPPCTYLSNVAVAALKDNPERVEQMKHSADLFRRIMDSDVPFVCNENPVMHRVGRNRAGCGDPSQYVQPFQHGTPHQKRTGLHLKGLPLLVPTCEVEGRERPMANLPESPHRSDQRSRTYVGIGGAMVTQWLPLVMAHVAGQPKGPSSTGTAAQLVDKATSYRRVQASKVWFATRDANGEMKLCSHIRSDSRPQHPQYDTYGGMMDESDQGSPTKCAMRELREEAYLPPHWQLAMQRTMREFPSGHHQLGIIKERRKELHLLHLWVVELEPGTEQVPMVTPEGQREITPSSTAWRHSNKVIENIMERLPTYGKGLRSAVRRLENCLPLVASASSRLPPSFIPWRHPPVHTRRESIPVAPVRKIHYCYGKWRAWEAVPDSDPPQYAWRPIDPGINEELLRIYRPQSIREELESSRPPGEWHDQVTNVATVSRHPAAEASTQTGVYALLRNTEGPSADQHYLHDMIHREWDISERLMRQPDRAARGRGLGWFPGVSAARSSSEPPPSRRSRNQGRKKTHAPAVSNPPRRSLDEIRRAHARRFVSAGVPPASRHTCSPENSPTPAPSLAAGAIPEEKLRPIEQAMETPMTKLDYHHCLYLQGVTVCRSDPTRHRKGKRFWVDRVLTDVSRTLPDTGAAPSLITTELLALLPKDALVERDRVRVEGAIEGPDGSPLALEGYAKVTFDIDGAVYTHRFTVAEGKPLLILGNDFLAPWKAQFTLNEDGQGRGTLSLDGRTFKVTSNARDLSSMVASVTTNVPPPVQLDGTREKPTSEHHPSEVEPVHADSELTGLTPADLARKNLVLVEGSYLLYTKEAVVLPPGTKRLVYAKAPHEVTQSKNPVQGVIGPLPAQLTVKGKCPQVLLMAANPDHHGMLPVMLWNTTRRQQTVPSFTPMASYDVEFTIHEPSNDKQGPVTKYKDLTPELKAVVDQVQIDRQQRLTPEQTARAKDLVSEFADIFALDPKNPKHTHLMEVALALKPGAQPHRHAPSRMGPEGQKIVDKHIDEMESRNIIRKSNSAWGSRVVLVTKKDGSIRFCVDYRDTNSKLQIMDSPIPLTADAIDRLASGQGDPSSLFISTMDLASGFWCLPIREQDKHLTSFVTHRGKYEFNYLPFGIQCGPSYMCRLMDSALEGLAWDICMPYLDDTATWSTGTGATSEERENSSFEQMMQRLRLVFERFRWAQLSCKASKCDLFATSAPYLGHVVNRNGLEMDPEKIRKIKEIDTTAINGLGRVRSFLGLASYYRRFVKGFAKIAAPLHDLTRDGVDVPVLSQEPKAQQAMKELIGALTSEPVLAMPRFDRTFIVKTDAAEKEGVGGVLSQHDDDRKERVNAYYGRRLSKEERKWTVTEIELLAALESITNWRPYLWGREFRLVIDHAALRWLHTMRDTFEGGPSSRLMRWIMKLSEYRFTVEHKPGALHQDADGVSRLVDLVAAALTQHTTAGEPMTMRACVACRNELRQWATKHQPDGSDYLNVRQKVIDAYWETTAPTVAAARITARKLQADARNQRNRSESRTNIQNYYLNTGAPSLDLTREAQQEDSDCRYLSDILVSGTAGDPHTPDEWKRTAWALREVRHLEIRDGILYRVDPVNDGPLRIYVPQSHREAMLNAFHDHFGHRHYTATLKALAARHYWPGMSFDTAQHVRFCHECTLAKRTRRSRQSTGPKHGHYPFDLLYVDVLDMAKTHDYVEGKSGYSKLLVFVDALTRWVEAVPFNGDPTSEQVLDAFLTHVVTRHGCPRTLRSDLGSNLASELTDEILTQTGVNLRPSTAEHHESVGMVERFNSTLEGMTRASDEGGLHWVDHLPFLLMSYHATPHRVTQLSPASMLYGRELRLPSQMAHPDAAGESASDASAPDAVREYAIKLHNQCVWAWSAASDAYYAAQSEAMADKASKTHNHVFKVDDRVARLLPGRENKLRYLWSGPYRIAEVMPDGRYRLRDLENNQLGDEFDASNLRPYRTVVDEEDLQPDEYVIDYIFGRRDRRGAREYRIKWRHYPRSQATWEPRAEIERRAASLVEEYEASLLNADESDRENTPSPAARPLRKTSHAKPPSGSMPPPAGSDVPPSSHEEEASPPIAPPHQYDSDDLPIDAKFERGQWSYGRYVATPRGRKLRRFQPSAFTPAELDSPHFADLRNQWLASNPQLVAVVSCHFSAGVPDHNSRSTFSPILVPVSDSVIEDDESAPAGGTHQHSNSSQPH